MDYRLVSVEKEVEKCLYLLENVTSVWPIYNPYVTDL